MSKCSLGSTHESDSYARRCDEMNILFACAPRLIKIRDEHPKRRIRQAASDQLMLVQRRSTQR
jgi:hypothetical protein